MSSRVLSRRRLLAGGAGMLAAGAAAGCGASASLHTADPPSPLVHDLDGTDYGHLIPDVDPGPIETGRFRSPDLLDVEVPWVIMRPPGHPHDRLPVVVALHGHGGSVGQLVEQWQVPRFLAAAVQAGVPPFAIAAANGGDSFWHPRPTGEDAGAMVLDELIPRLVAHGLAATPVDRIGLLGWSMGGYGVLRLAGLLGARRVAAVVAGSPALYTNPAEAHPDGFADPAEYEEFSVMHDQAQLTDIALRIDVGREDYFFNPVRDYVAGFPSSADVTVSYGDAGHEIAYSLSTLPTDLAFLGRHLTPA